MRTLLETEFYLKFIEPFLFSSFYFPTPIYKTANYFGREVLIKRDDMLYNNINGSKQRKLYSLLYYAKKYNKLVIANGSSHSNMLLALASIFKQEQVPFNFYIKKPRSENYKGNYLLLKTLAESNLKELDSNHYDDIVNELECQNSISFYINEGAFQPESFPGLWTLGNELLAQFKDSEIPKHIFIDSGSGATATSLLLYLETIGYSGTLHITLIAGTEDEFKTNYQTISQELNRFFSVSIFGKENVKKRFLYPNITKSFGSQNKTLWLEWKKISEETGLLLDIVYSIKHFYRVKEFINSNSLDETPLIILSGGGGLFGMETQIESLLI
jgi:1-aminocyclopropane-1-carboxylate deaminase/D-cysteine desulfhydrase-like pyridoxal-dependent ACC family enzyme